MELRSYKTMSPKGDSRQLNVDTGRIAICISAICVTSSFLFTRQEKRGLIQRTLAGRFHTQEWERYCGCIGMVFGHTKMNAQYDEGALSFTSKSDARAHIVYFFLADHLIMCVAASSSASLPPDMFSPGKKVRGGVKTVLNYDDESECCLNPLSHSSVSDHWLLVIVYDLRQVRLKNFDFPSILDNPTELAEIPRFREEIPVGSLVVVAHTVSVYVGGKGDVAKVNSNFQWAMLIGVPR